MAQLTVRTSEGLVARVKAEAAAQGRSMNDYVTAVLAAAVDPDLAGDDAAAIRARLRQAGLLVEPQSPASRPSRGDVDRARRSAGEGTPLADLVARNRG